MGGIIWLASYPKSGNTWLRAFLHNFLRDPAASYDINRLSDLSQGDGQTDWYRRFDPRPGSQYSLDDVRRLRPVVHRAIASASPDSVFVKTHNALLEDEGHPLITLDVTAGAVYVVRNPLDVAISFSHHLGITLDATIAMMNDETATTANDDTNVYEFYSTWARHVLSWTREENRQLHVMRYEDMLEAPLRSFTALVRFLGIDAPRARIERAIRLSSFRVLQEQERRQGFRERSPKAEAFFRVGRAGQWKKALTPDQVAALVAVNRDQMERFGYLPPGA